MTEITALTTLPELAEYPALSEIYQQGISLRQYAEERAIACDADLKPATDDLSIISGMLKDIEEIRKKIVSPLREKLDSINEAFKLLKAPFSEADSINRNRVQAYRAEQARRQQEAQRIEAEKLRLAREEMALKGETTVDLTPIETAPVVQHVRTDMGTVGVAKVWKFEVVDFAALPDQYKLPDLVKIRKVITAGVSIPGVKAYQEDSLRVTPK